MKFYIAARTSQLSIVKEMVKEIELEGHEISHDWTAVKDADLPRPYSAHAEKVRIFAENGVEGVKNADVFVILSDIGGTGMYVEMGMALASNARIYTVGENNDVTVFHFHPRVNKVSSLKDVFKDLKI
jgi:hypothetical protein